LSKNIAGVWPHPLVNIVPRRLSPQETAGDSSDRRKRSRYRTQNSEAANECFATP